MENVGDLTRIFGDVLRLCKLKKGEVFAVLTEGNSQAAYTEAYLRAAEDLGAFAFQLNIAKQRQDSSGAMKRTSLTGNQGAVEVLKTADLIIDMVGLLWSPEQSEIQQAGARILMCLEPIDVITRMFPSEKLRAKVEKAEKILKNGKELRITSRSGTDVTYKLGQYPVITQYGYTDEPGRWDHLPGGFVFTGGSDGGVNGTVVVGVGDILLPFKRYVSAPIRLSIKNGMVNKIEGDHPDAEMLRSFMNRWQDPRAYAISHIGWGMDEKAQWEFLGTNPNTLSEGADARAFSGNVLFSTGPNNELGGDNDTPCHLDIPLRGCDLFVDGIQILQQGEVVNRELTADA